MSLRRLRSGELIARGGEGGRIIVVGSPAGQRGNFGQTNYAAAKAGITAFARTWALELARAQITVNALIPTAWTAMTASIATHSATALTFAARPLRNQRSIKK